MVETALAEDLGSGGDLTSDAIFPIGHRSSARIVAREPGRVAGTDAIVETYAMLDASVAVDVLAEDGSEVGRGSVIATIDGPTRSVLSGERVALNLLGRACGIATRTAGVVATIAGTGAVVADTRKTTPGLRALEKHAVRMGGGRNHRFRLDDAVMVKDNHIAAAGGIREAVQAVKSRVGHTVKIEVEVDTLDQLAELLDIGADIVLLDNMSPETLREAVAMVDGSMVTEASGGITPDNARAHAETGVDVLSMGWLTHSAPVLDVSMEVGA